MRKTYPSLIAGTIVGAVSPQPRCREEVRFSEFSSWLANPTTVVAFVSLQLITTRLLVYNVGALHANFHHMGHVHGISHGSLDTWLLYTSTTVNSLRYWIPPPVVVTLLWEFAGSSLKGYLSFTLDGSCLQRLKIPALFTIPLSVTLFLTRDPSC